MADDSSLSGRFPQATWAQVSAWFAGHGFWRLALESGELEWSDSLFEEGGTRGIEPGDQSLILKAIHPDDLPRLEEGMRTVAERRVQTTIGIRLRRDEHAWRMLSVQMTPEIDARGVVVAVRGMVVDITEIELCRIVSQLGNDIISQTNRHGLITYVSASAEKVTGFAPEEIVGRSLQEVLGEEAATALAAATRSIMADPDAPPPQVEYPITHKDGRRIWLESRPILARDERTGKMLGSTDVVRDITRRKQAEGELERAKILLETLIQASPAAVVVVDHDRRITSFNSKFAEMWQVDEATLREADFDAVLDQALRLVRDDFAARARIRDVDRDPDGEAHDEIETTDGRWIDRYTVPVRTGTGGHLGRAWFFRDVTEHKQALEEAVRMSRFDQLTSLANRSVLLEALDRAIQQARRRDVAFAIFYLDLDDFKDVNDTQGHLVGDELLIAVAERLRTRVRDTDIVARIGGDEFAILVSDLRGATDAALLADEIIKVLSEPYCLSGTVIHTSACIGIDLFGPEATDGRTLLSHADIALYQAKASGAGVYRFFTEAMDNEVRTRVSLGTELREAIERGQLFLLYQPAVELRTGKISGVEALVRWNHPTRGMLSPDLFIPVAEQMGLIGSLGRWVLWTAARQAKSWADQGIAPLRMAINVSALQFKTPAALEADVGAVLAATGLDPSLLELELTESALMTASEGSDILMRLHDRGVGLAIDDFGTGYSSLDYLRRFPATRIKIDRTFVSNLGSRSGDAAIVRATIGLARELGMTVIAEGIETEQQARMLAEWGCFEGQGYYYDRPLNPYAMAMRARIGSYAGFGPPVLVSHK